MNNIIETMIGVFFAVSTLLVLFMFFELTSIIGEKLSTRKSASRKRKSLTK